MHMSEKRYYLVCVYNAYKLKNPGKGCILYTNACVPCIMDIVEGKNTATKVQTLDEAVCISHTANILGKGMNPIILSSAMDKIVELDSLALVW